MPEALLVTNRENRLNSIKKPGRPGSTIQDFHKRVVKKDQKKIETS